MIIDPAQYTQLIQEIRDLKALNQTLTFQNEALIEKLITTEKQKDTLQIQYAQFKQQIKNQHEELLQSFKNQVTTINNELSIKQQQQIAYFENKCAELQKRSHQKLKKMEVQFKDFRLKSHLNDEFVNKLLKLYPQNYNPGMPELYSWIKKAVNKEKATSNIFHNVGTEKQNKKIINKTLINEKSKKKLFQCTK